MLDIKLPDGKIIQFKNHVNGFRLVEKISKSLAKEACIMSVDGRLKDLSYEIKKNSTVRIITSKDKEGLEVLRHDTAHILAMAVQELFSGTQVTIGPVIEDGFYYDFSRQEPFTEDDLKKIENRMKEIIDRDEKTTREVWKRNDAISHFKKIGEHYKSEIIKDIPKEKIDGSGTTDDKLLTYTTRNHDIIASLDRGILNKAVSLNIDSVTIEKQRLIWRINYNR